MYLRAVVALALVTLAANHGGAITMTQGTSRTCADAVDLVFRFSEGMPAEFREFDYRVVVRFRPAFGPESQIQILGRGEDSVRVIEEKLKPGIHSVEEECGALLEANPDASTHDIAKRIGVEKREITSQNYSELLEEFFRLSIPTHLSPDLCMDGTTYELWVQTASNKIHASLSDCVFGTNTASHPLIRWVKLIQARALIPSS